MAAKTQAQLVGAAELPVGPASSKKPTYEERVAADLAKQHEASEKLHRAIRLQQGKKA